MQQTSALHGAPICCSCATSEYKYRAHKQHVSHKACEHLQHVALARAFLLCCLCSAGGSCFSHCQPSQLTAPGSTGGGSCSPAGLSINRSPVVNALVASGLHYQLHQQHRRQLHGQQKVSSTTAMGLRCMAERLLRTASIPTWQEQFHASVTNRYMTALSAPLSDWQ